MALAEDPVKRREAAAHAHGVGRLSVVLDAKKLQLDFKIPLADLVGFERQPRNEAERNKLTAALRDENFKDSVVINPEGRCQLSTTHVHSAYSDGQETHVAHQGKSSTENGHADVNVGLAYLCDNPEGVTRVEFGLFKKFPAIHKVEVQYVVPQIQGAVVLSAQANALLIPNHTKKS